MGKSLHEVRLTKAQSDKLEELFGTRDPHKALAQYRMEQFAEHEEITDNLPILSGPPQPLLWEERYI